MNHLRTSTLVVAAALLLSVPAALASPPTNPGSNGKHRGNTNSSRPQPKTSLPAKAKAYVFYCKDESRTHVAGQKGTPFSQCVTAAATAAAHPGTSPRSACSHLSKTHHDGQKGTDYSICVSGIATLLEQHKTP